MCGCPIRSTWLQLRGLRTNWSVGSDLWFGRIYLCDEVCIIVVWLVRGTRRLVRDEMSHEWAEPVFVSTHQKIRTRYTRRYTSRVIFWRRWVSWFNPIILSRTRVLLSISLDKSLLSRSLCLSLTAIEPGEGLGHRQRDSAAANGGFLQVGLSLLFSFSVFFSVSLSQIPLCFSLYLSQISFCLYDSISFYPTFSQSFSPIDLSPSLSVVLSVSRWQRERLKARGRERSMGGESLRER